MNDDGFKYGPKLDEYLDLRRLGVGVSGYKIETPCEHKIEAAIDSLNNPRSVNFGTFETILSMEESPACAYMYLLLSDVKVFPSCIRLLRAYCKEGRGILDHAYGFLCLQVMALSVEIAKLNQTEQLDIVLQILTQTTVEFPASDMLSHYSRRCEVNEFCEDEYLRPSPQLLGWHTDPDTSLETCLACIGGCNIQDVQFLVDQLWSARSALLGASEYAAVNFPGWCGLFYVMHDTLVKVFGNFTRRSETAGERTYWIHLLELIHRYSLYSQASEDSSLSFLLRDCPQFAEDCDATVATPVESAQIVKAYIDKIGRLPTFKYAYVTRLYKFVCANYHVDTVRSDEHLNSLSAASLEESWAELLRASELEVGQWYQLSNTIATNSAILLMQKNHPVNEPLLLSILTHDNFFEFLGRLILFPVSIDGETIGKNRHLEWESHSHEALSMSGRLIRTRLAPEFFEPEPKLLSAWNKIYQCFQFHKNMSSREVKYKQDYAYTWESAWLHIGVALNLVRPMEFWMQCHYPRCAAPHPRDLFVCARCSINLYCSPRCYQADWVNAEDPHRNRCRNLA